MFRVWLKLLISISLCFVCCIQGASAYRYVVYDQRLDRALMNALVVYGQIIQVRREKAQENVIDSPGDRLIGTFQVEKVLLDERFRDRDYVLTHFGPLPKQYTVICHPLLQDWPEILVPFIQGRHSILVFSPTGWLSTVVPAGALLPNSLTSGSHDKALRNLLVKVLSNELLTEKTVERQRKLVLQVSSIMTPSEATAVLTPFLDSKDEWLRRAAIAGLVFATREPRHVQRAVSDLHNFLTSKGEIARIQKRESAYNRLFAYYFFLEPDWSTEEIAKLTPFIPLFRVVLSDLTEGKNTAGFEPSDKNSFSYGDEGYYRYMYGLRPLSGTGTRNDLLALYHYHDDHRVNFRQAALAGIPRILNIGLPSYDSTDFLRNEKEQQKQIREALVRAKFIPAK